MDRDSCYDLFNKSPDFCSFLKSGAEIRCVTAEEWDMTLDFAMQAGFEIGFERDEYRPGTMCESMNIYYAEEIDEVHTKWDPGTGVLFAEVYQRFFGSYNDHIEVDENIVLFA